MSPSECAHNVTVLWWLDGVFWRWPLHIRILSIGLLVSSFFVLQLTAIQPFIAFIPALEDNVKVRPAGFISDMNVVTLEEADRRYNERHGYALPDPDADYGKDCFFGSCSLEVTLLMAKYSLANWLRP